LPLKLLKFLSRIFSPPVRGIRLSRSGYYHYRTGKYFPGRAGDLTRVRAQYDGGDTVLFRKEG
jgi:hypothetical protein